jgi:regulator of replication initiation timing
MDSVEDIEREKQFKEMEENLKFMESRLMKLMNENDKLKVYNEKLKIKNKELNKIISKCPKTNKNKSESMERRFMLAPSGVFIRDLKHMESYGDIDEIIDVMNRVNKTDNCAVDIIKKEIKEQEDENVIIVLENILKQIIKISSNQ